MTAPVQPFITCRGPCCYNALHDDCDNFDCVCHVTSALPHTSKGTLTAHRQLEILRVIAYHNARGHSPNRYVVASATGNNQNRTHGFTAIRRLIREGLVLDLSTQTEPTAKLILSPRGREELQYWLSRFLMA